ncbi:Sec-independent protein translocase protein TatB [Samsonia erythrinae]|uniref:Sec-independent protein translocase protein TatB n=1 Tax=Samsonia erythrinae TaxID=160434 RepID=A0A4R3VB95_9GAMM|nr:Sec-independent protein translocase protein TatB [Samsonia erythrinae]TCV02537.1 sec-independent protein translocase protein TatB [Samsonia erythrinae]
MFDIGFGELMLVMVLGLVVLGPERLPVAVRTVASWIRTLRSLASTVQNELSQELKLQEFQESLKKVEKAGLQNLSPELKASMDELKEAAEAMKRGYSEKSPDENAAQDAAVKTQYGRPLDDPEAAYDGVIATETAARAEGRQHQPENGGATDYHRDVHTVIDDKAVSNESVKPEQSQPSAVAAHQPSDNR